MVLQNLKYTDEFIGTRFNAANLGDSSSTESRRLGGVTIPVRRVSGGRGNGGLQ